MTTPDVNVEKLDAAMQLIQEVRDDLASGSTPAPPDRDVIEVPLGASLQTAIDAADAGAVLLLDAGAYEGSITIRKPLTLRTRNLAGVTVGPIMPTEIVGTTEATITCASQDSSDWIHLEGLGVSSTRTDGDLIVVTGVQTAMDRVACWGHPVEGAHRGMLLQGQAMRLRNIWIDDIFGYGRECAGIGGWDGTADLDIDGAYICAAGMAVMFGGADSASAERMPRDIRIVHFHFTKKPAWYSMTSGGQAIVIKNAFELKVGRNVYVADGVMEYAGVSQGQDGYLIVLTVRNQNGDAPWSTLCDVTIERVAARYGGGCVSFLGRDDREGYDSEQCDHITLRNCTFDAIDPQGITGGAGRCFTFNHAPKGVTLEAITVHGRNLHSLGYFPPAGKTPPREPVGLTLCNWQYPTTKYGWKIDAGGGDVPPAHAAISAYMPDLTYAITATDPGAVGAPVFPTRASG